MPLIFQHMIFRRDLRANRDHLYLFGDNEERKGLGGQAGEMRGEPNAHGIRVKRAPSWERWAFWTDEDFDRVCLLIKEDFEKPYRWINAGKIVVVPERGLGTERGALHTDAPRILEFINEKITLLHRIGEELVKDQEQSRPPE